MCIGLPMRVISVSRYQALCEADGETRMLDTALLGETLQPGDHVLSHNGRALRRLDPDEAEAIAAALKAVLIAARGGDFTPFIADLIDREPPLPEHLQAEIAARQAAS